MGWAISAETRTTWLHGGKCLRYVAPVDGAMGGVTAAAVLVDGNAALRSGCVGQVPATVVVKRLLRTVGFPKYVKRLCVAFDNSNIPPARTAVHASRKTKIKVEPASDQQIAGSSTTAMLVPWQQLFASISGKRRAYALLVDALKSEVVRCGAPRFGDKPDSSADVCVAISVPYSNTVWTYPFDESAMTLFRLEEFVSYGEAEAQIVMCAEQLIKCGLGPLVIVTIDTDILLQTLGIWARDVYIYLAKVWVVMQPKAKHKRSTAGRDMSQCHRTAGKAKQAAKACNGTVVCRSEFVSCNAMRRFLGPTARQMANSLLWMLLAGGVDYNRGLGGFGWYSKTCLGLYRTDVLLSLSREKVVVDMVVLRRTLKRARNRKTQEKSCNALIAELNNALYCFAYYVWFDDGRAGAAGPRVSTTVALSVPDRTVSWFLSASSVQSTATLTNEWPGSAAAFVPLVNRDVTAHAAFVQGGCCR